MAEQIPELEDLLELDWWYHGSRNKFRKLKRHNARAVPGSPEKDRQNAIYLTPNRANALAMGVSYSGLYNVDYAIPESGKRRIQLEGKLFEKNPIYLYLFKPKKVLKEAGKDGISVLDPSQIAVYIDELKPDQMEEYPLSEVTKHFQILVKKKSGLLRLFTKTRIY